MNESVQVESAPTRIDMCGKLKLTLLSGFGYYLWVTCLNRWIFFGNYFSFFLNVKKMSRFLVQFELVLQIVGELFPTRINLYQIDQGGYSWDTNKLSSPVLKKEWRTCPKCIKKIEHFSLMTRFNVLIFQKIMPNFHETWKSFPTFRSWCKDTM